MKTQLTLLLTIAAFSFNLFAEETELTQYTATGVNIPVLSRLADVAGVGVAENIDKGKRTVDIRVSDFWTGEEIGTNVITISAFIYDNTPIPTNVPIVFFAMMSQNDGAWEANTPGPAGFDYRNKYTNVTATARFEFFRDARAWFRTTRDNGLLYTFTTNVWHHTRVNPNVTNYYHVVREGDKVSPEASWRVQMDARGGLSHLAKSESESFLVYMFNDPLLESRFVVRRWLSWRFGWEYRDGTFHPPAADKE